MAPSCSYDPRLVLPLPGANLDNASAKLVQMQAACQGVYWIVVLNTTYLHLQYAFGLCAVVACAYEISLRTLARQVSLDIFGLQSSFFSFFFRRVSSQNTSTQEAASTIRDLDMSLLLHASGWGQRSFFATELQSSSAFNGAVQMCGGDHVFGKATGRGAMVQFLTKGLKGGETWAQMLVERMPPHILRCESLEMFVCFPSFARTREEMHAEVRSKLPVVLAGKFGLPAALLFAWEVDLLDVLEPIAARLRLAREWFLPSSSCIYQLSRQAFAKLSNLNLVGPGHGGGNPSCWTNGFTYELCCKTNATHCWGFGQSLSLELKAFNQNDCCGLEYSSSRRDSSFPTYLYGPEHDLLNEYVGKSASYFEWGTGGSTVFASNQPQLSNIVAVDSDWAWLNRLSHRRDIGSAMYSNRLKLVFANIGITGQWGVPLSSVGDWNSYFTAMDLFDTRSWDVIFIDGRFRVACFLSALKRSGTSTHLFVHDYAIRRNLYGHMMNKYANLVQVVHTMALFRPSAKVIQRDPETMDAIQHDLKFFADVFE